VYSKLLFYAMLTFGNALKMYNFSGMKSGEEL